MKLRADGPDGPKKRAIVTTETLQGDKNTHKLKRNETVPVGQNPDATNGPDLYSNFIDYTPNPELVAKREREYADKKKADAEAQSKWMAEHKGPTISSKPLHIGKEEAAGIAANTITLGFASCTTLKKDPITDPPKEPEITVDIDNDVNADANAEIGINTTVNINPTPTVNDDDLLDPITTNIGVSDNTPHGYLVEPGDDPNAGDTKDLLFKFLYTDEMATLRKVDEGDNVNPNVDIYKGDMRLNDPTTNQPISYKNSEVTFTKISDTQLKYELKLNNKYFNSSIIDTRDPNVVYIISENDKVNINGKEVPYADYVTANYFDKSKAEKSVNVKPEDFPSGCYIMLKRELGEDGKYYQNAYIKSNDNTVSQQYFKWKITNKE